MPVRVPVIIKLHVVYIDEGCLVAGVEQGIKSQWFSSRIGGAREGMILHVEVVCPGKENRPIMRPRSCCHLILWNLRCNR